MAEAGATGPRTTRRRAEEDSKKNAVAVNGTHTQPSPAGWRAEGHLDFPSRTALWRLLHPGQVATGRVAIGDSILDLALLEEPTTCPRR